MAYDWPEGVSAKYQEPIELPPEQDLLFRAMEGADVLYFHLLSIPGQEDAAEAVGAVAGVFLEQAAYWSA